MVAKIFGGMGFAGLVAYANNIREKDARILHAFGVSTASNQTVVASLNNGAKGCKVQKYVGHLMLSFAPEDTPKLDDKLMTGIALEYMRRMNIVNTQYVIYLHNDKKHKHLHIVYNRVNIYKKTLHGDQNYKCSMKAATALSLRYGLRLPAGKTGANRKGLRGRDAAKYYIYDNVRELLPAVATKTELQKRLAERGIDMRYTTGGCGVVTGVSFSYANQAFAGSKVDPGLTWHKIYSAIYERGAGAAAAPTGELSEDNAESNILTPQFSQKQSTRGLHYEAFQADDSSDSGGTIDEAQAVADKLTAAAVELVAQPHTVPTACGGGSSDDEDEDRRKRRGRRR